DKITGRSDDMLIIRGVNVFPTQIEEQILKIPALAPHYEIIVSKQGNLDVVNVKAELNPAAQDADQTAIIKELQHHIKSVVGISTKVDIVPVGGLARSEGKAKRVTDLR
ncbi:phenylacetate--CoA ligase, partial [Oceanospirillum sp. HFRX-1_2]